MGLIEQIEAEGMKENVPSFNVGDTVKVGYRIIEGGKERIQNFEGVVIAKKNGGIRETFTVRRLSFGVGVERCFPLHSPKIAYVNVVRAGKVRRAKLYYLRGRTGKDQRKEVRERETAERAVFFFFGERNLQNCRKIRLQFFCNGLE